jgi:hypothetical protein
MEAAMDLDLEKLKKAALAATPGEWGVDTVRNDGEYGIGDEGTAGFDSYVVVDAEGNTLFDTLNYDQGVVEEEFDEDFHRAWDESARRNTEFVAKACPAAVLQIIADIERKNRTLDDCAALVGRLVRAIRKAAPDNDLAGQAMDYLNRNCLAGSPLRKYEALIGADKG